MTFGEYYSKNGRNEAYIRLQNSKQSLLKRIRNNKTSYNTMILSEKLTKLFYPPKGDRESQEISQQFNLMLKNAFEELSQKKIYEKDFNVGKGGYHEQKKPSLVSTGTYSAIQNLLLRIEKEMKELMKADNPQEINQIVGSLEMNSKKAVEIIAKTLDEIGTNKNKTINFSKTDFISVGEAYNYLRVLENLVKPGKVFTKTDMGNILEFALGLLDEDLNFSTEQIIEENINQIKQQVIGSTPTKRQSQGVFMDMYLDEKSLAQITKTKMMRTGKKTTYQIGDFIVDRASQINPGSEKYGKIDVYKNSDLRISAKNWSSLTYQDYKTKEMKMRTVGGAKLLDALARTTKVLDYYMWLFQDKNAKQYYPLAHTVAQLSAYTDIALGFGNRATANTLIINQRDKKRVLVIDMNQEILNAIEGKKSKFILMGYGPDHIEKMGRKIGLTSRKYGVNASRLYYTLMYDFLASQRVFVEMSSDLI